MFRLMGREIGAECWLLTGTGRVVGGTGASLSRPLALERARLDASRTGGRKLAEAIITMLASGGGEGAAPVEIASLMRAIGMSYCAARRPSPS